MAKINLRKIEDLGVEEGYSSKLFTKLVNDILLLLGIHAEANKLFIESWMQDISQAWEGFDYDDAEKIIKETKMSPTVREFFLEGLPKGIKKTEEKIEDVKSSSKKLPSKKLKLESMFESISKELLTMPPHYKMDGYNVILTTDINANNYSRMINNFSAGRIISSGKVSEATDDFIKELIFKL
jgi:hypothetical protein